MCAHSGISCPQAAPHTSNISASSVKACDRSSSNVPHSIMANQVAVRKSPVVRLCCQNRVGWADQVTSG